MTLIPKAPRAGSSSSFVPLLGSSRRYSLVALPGFPGRLVGRRIRNVVEGSDVLPHSVYAERQTATPKAPQYAVAEDSLTGRCSAKWSVCRPHAARVQPLAGQATALAGRRVAGWSATSRGISAGQQHPCLDGARLVRWRRDRAT